MESEEQTLKCSECGERFPFDSHEHICKTPIIQKFFSITQFGKDHWSLFGYIGTRVADYGGRLDLVHLRIKNPALQQNKLGTMLWKSEYGTRLKGYWNKDGSTNKELLILDHDDYDCLDDLEEAGLIKSFGTGLNPVYKLTKFGAKVHSELLLHKQAGKNYSDFELNTNGGEFFSSQP